VHGGKNVGLVVIWKRMNPAIVAIVTEPEMVSAAGTQKQHYDKGQTGTSPWCAIAVHLVPALSLCRRRAFNPEAPQAPYRGLSKGIIKSARQGLEGRVAIDQIGPIQSGKIK
jgi:hypothetical protein